MYPIKYPAEKVGSCNRDYGKYRRDLETLVEGYKDIEVRKNDDLCGNVYTESHQYINY